MSLIFEEHISSFSALNTGKISFQECWSKQEDILDKCEEQLRLQIEKLKVLTLIIKDPAEACNKDDEQSCPPKESSSPPTASAPTTWSAGVLSELIRGQSIASAAEPRDTESQEKKISEPLTSPVKETEEEKKEKTLVCTGCNSAFVNHIHVVKDHIESLHLKTQYSCTHCHHAWRWKKKCFKHIREVSGSRDERVVSEMLRYMCGVCGDDKKMTKLEFSIHVEEKHEIFQKFFQRTIAGRWYNKNKDASMIKPVKDHQEQKKERKDSEKTDESVKKGEDDGVSSFISEIENSLEKFSKIINESISESVTENKSNDEIKRQEAFENNEDKLGKDESMNEDSKKTTSKRLRSKCKYCKEDFSGRRAARKLHMNHMLKLHMMVRFACTLCDFTCQAKGSFTKHLHEKHLEEHQNRAEQLYTFQCPFCEVKFENELSYLVHFENSHINKMKGYEYYLANKTKNRH